MARAAGARRSLRALRANPPGAPTWSPCGGGRPGAAAGSTADRREACRAAARARGRARRGGLAGGGRAHRRRRRAPRWRDAAARAPARGGPTGHRNITIAGSSNHGDRPLSFARKGYPVLAVADAPAFTSKRAIDATRKDSTRLGRNGAPAFADAHAVCVRIGACVGRRVTNTARSSRKIFQTPAGAPRAPARCRHSRDTAARTRSMSARTSAAVAPPRFTMKLPCSSDASAPHLGALASRRLDETAGRGSLGVLEHAAAGGFGKRLASPAPGEVALHLVAHPIGVGGLGGQLAFQNHLVRRKGAHAIAPRDLVAAAPDRPRPGR